MPFFVGASLLAKNVNDNACFLDVRGVHECFASKNQASPSLLQKKRAVTRSTSFVAFSYESQRSWHPCCTSPDNRCVVSKNCGSSEREVHEPGY
ncbi:hypothetical protein CUU62_19860 [Pseudomonas sp. WP001]|nr:hypothetical protein CUU62_19860 [Pseudomonas sp. WP001]